MIKNLKTTFPQIPNPTSFFQFQLFNPSFFLSSSPSPMIADQSFSFSFFLLFLGHSSPLMWRSLPPKHYNQVIRSWCLPRLIFSLIFLSFKFMFLFFYPIWYHFWFSVPFGSSPNHSPWASLPRKKKKGNDVGRHGNLELKWKEEQ